MRTSLLRFGCLATVSATVALVVAAAQGDAGTVRASSGTWMMTSEPGDSMGQGRSYSLDVASNQIQFGVMNWGEVRVHAQLDGDLWMARFAAPGDAPLVPGVYEDASNDPGADHPFLSVTGNSYGCPSSGRFTVLEATYGLYGYLQSFHATFEQRCGVSTSALRGEIDLVAPPPPGPLQVDGTVDDRAPIDRADGTVELSGTVACSQPVLASISAGVTQQTKKGVAEAHGNVTVECNPTPTTWTVKTKSSTGIPFVRGTMQFSGAAYGVDSWYTAYHDNLQLIVITDTIAGEVWAQPG